MSELTAGRDRLAPESSLAEERARLDAIEKSFDRGFGRRVVKVNGWSINSYSGGYAVSATPISTFVAEDLDLRAAIDIAISLCFLCGLPLSPDGHGLGECVPVHDPCEGVGCDECWETGAVMPQHKRRAPPTGGSQP